MFHDSFVRAPPGAARNRIDDFSTQSTKRSRRLSPPSLRLQRHGLSERIADATAAAAFAAGNGVYEHLTREAGDTNSLRRWETELIFARARLQVIDKNISHIEVLRVAYLSVFPDSAARR